MKISPYRTSYIVDKTYRITLLSTILTALTPLIATLVDGLFCSNMLGRDAFVAVSTTLPVVNAVGILTLICCRGGAALAAGRLVKGDMDKAQRIFTVSLITSVLVAILVALTLWINIDAVALALTGRPECATYVREYMGIILLYFIIIPFNNTFNDFATNEGYPQLTTRAVMAGCSANVVLDLLFIGVFHMGISGAAWGTVVSGFINLCLIMPYFLSGKSQCRLAKLKGDTWSILWNNLKQGFGFNVFYIVVNAFMLLGSALVLRVAGIEGLTLFDVCMQIQSATFSVVVGVCIASISHVTYLRVVGDSQGLQRIMGSTRNLVLWFYGLLALLMILVPQFFLWCFGLTGVVDVAMARKVFACYAIYYFCFCMVSVYVTVVLQLAGHVGAKIVLVFSMGIITYLCMLGLSWIDSDAMWMGMIVGSVPLLVASLAFGYWQYRKHPGYTKFTLIDRFPKYIRLDYSLDYEHRNIEGIKRDFRTFADACEMPEEIYKKVSQAGSMLYHIAQEHRYKRLKYLDVCFVEMDDCFSMTFKDCGQPFSPLTYGISAQSFGADTISYRYMFSMNVTTVTWNKPQSVSLTDEG